MTVEFASVEDLDRILAGARRRDEKGLFRD